MYPFCLLGLPFEGGQYFAYLRLLQTFRGAFSKANKMQNPKIINFISFVMVGKRKPL